MLKKKLKKNKSVGFVLFPSGGFGGVVHIVLTCPGGLSLQLLISVNVSQQTSQKEKVVLGSVKCICGSKRDFFFFPVEEKSHL